MSAKEAASLQKSPRKDQLREVLPREVLMRENQKTGSPDAAGPVIHDLGVHSVTVETAALSAYCEATCALAGDISPPVAFPMIWLTTDALKQSALALAGADCLPVHESQSFDYSARLRIGATYRMTAKAQLQQEPHRLILEAVVQSGAGAVVLTMRCVLRLVPIKNLPSAASAQ